MALRRREAPGCFSATEDVYNSSQTYDDFRFWLVLVYLTDVSQEYRRNVINLTQCAAQALGDADCGLCKAVVRRRSAAKWRCGCHGRGRCSPRIKAR